MTRQLKIVQHFTKEITDDIVTGIFAVHGNVDEGLDRSHPGAFADVRIKGRDRVRFLWQHDSREPPIAAIKSIREVTRDQLPAEVLAYAPDATGGCEVVRQYLSTERGQEVLIGLNAGTIEEMSYAYDVLEYKFTVDEESDRTIRELIKLALYDISDVNWGMNSATLASKSGIWSASPVKDHTEMIKTVLDEYLERMRELHERRSKEGRILSETNRSLIKDVSGQLQSTEGSLAAVRKALLDLLAATEPKQDDDNADRIKRLYAQYQRILALANGVR